MLLGLSQMLACLFPIMVLYLQATLHRASFSVLFPKEIRLLQFRCLSILEREWKGKGRQTVFELGGWFQPNLREEVGACTLRDTESWLRRCPSEMGWQVKSMWQQVVLAPSTRAEDSHAVRAVLPVTRSAGCSRGYRQYHMGCQGWKDFRRTWKRVNEDFSVSAANGTPCTFFFFSILFYFEH